MSAATEATYWETIVQLIPVVTLAVVLEAREVRKQWTQATPRFLRWFDGTLWAAMIVGLAVSEIIALTALRGDPASEFAVKATSATVIATFVMLAGVPVLELLTGTYAEGLAWMLTRHPRTRISRFIGGRKMTRDLRRMEREFAHLQREREQSRLMSEDFARQLDQSEGDLDRMVPQDPEQEAEVERLRAKLSTTRDVLTKSAAIQAGQAERSADMEERMSGVRARHENFLKTMPALQREYNDLHRQLMIAALLPPAARSGQANS